MEKKVIKIPVWDLETNTLVEIEIEQDALDAMDAADKEVELQRQRIDEEDQNAWLYVRDD